MMVLDYGPRIDECLSALPSLLLAKIGLSCHQRIGYKCWKIPGRNRNWCQLVDGDVRLRTHFPNLRGGTKSWKLFARFGSAWMPQVPWDEPEVYERPKAYWMPAGDDVWGIAYEDLREYTRITCPQLLERLVEDLKISFEYSLQHYGQVRFLPLQQGRAKRSLLRDAG
jgi:hypothetical protein